VWKDNGGEPAFHTESTNESKTVERQVSKQEQGQSMIMGGGEKREAGEEVVGPARRWATDGFSGASSPYVDRLPDLDNGVLVTAGRMVVCFS
jgi:hypothetical protein